VHLNETRRYTDHKKRLIESRCHSPTHLDFNVGSINIDTIRVNSPAASACMSRCSREDVSMLIYGHRGASASEPENTLRAFSRAIEMGVAGLETDVQVTSDRVPVLLHDRDLARTTNGAGAIDRIESAALRAIDVGQGEPVPTLAEALELAGDRIHWDIEIKQGGVERETLDVLAAYPQARWAISSFDWTTIERIRALSADADLWLLAVLVSDALFHTARRLRASGVSLHHSALNDATAKRLHDAGLKIVIWTVNDVAEAARVRDLGAHALCTDTPDTIIAGLANA
jgi:glycerophosphoryl diester phosphodiesterase